MPNERGMRLAVRSDVLPGDTDAFLRHSRHSLYQTDVDVGVHRRIRARPPHAIRIIRCALAVALKYLHLGKKLSMVS